MKKAGAKNDGAWHRANRFLRDTPSADKNDLGVILNDLEEANDAFNNLDELRMELGITAGPGYPSTREAWIASMLQEGIPRQIWMGRLSFTTYARITRVAADDDYVPKYQPAIHAFGVVLRKTVRNFIFGYRAIRDLQNVGDLQTQNPGGLPNVDPET